MRGTVHSNGSTSFAGTSRRSNPCSYGCPRTPRNRSAHDSARGHVTGESIYIDDMPPLKNELIVDFFWSPVAHGRIRSLGLERAREVDGVAALFTYRDLHCNLFGPVISDEILLSEDKVTFIGQPIVIIAAENRDAIKAAKSAIAIDIEELEPVFTIDDAKKKREFIG